MPQDNTAQLGARHLLRADIRPKMAKADLRNPDMADWREQIGRAVGRVRTICGLSLKEFADAIGRDERQVARWVGGTERPQLDAIFSVPALRVALVQALAELSHDVEVTTTITIRRAG